MTNGLTQSHCDGFCTSDPDYDIAELCNEADQWLFNMILEPHPMYWNSWCHPLSHRAM